jgi:transposase
VISARKIHKVNLTQDDNKQLDAIISKGSHQARTITRARVLKMVHRGKTDKEIITVLNLNPSTVYEIRKRYCQGGPQRALYDAPRPGQKKVFTIVDEATVTALACTKAPDGHSRWTLELLKVHAKEKLGKSIGRNTIWKILLKNHLKPWRKKNVVYSQSYSRI